MILLRNMNVLQPDVAAMAAEQVDMMPDHPVEKIVPDTTIIVIIDHQNVLDQDLNDVAGHLMMIVIIDTLLLHAIDDRANEMIIIQEGIMIIVLLLDDVVHLDVDIDPITVIVKAVWIDHLPRWHVLKNQNQGMYFYRLVCD